MIPFDADVGLDKIISAECPYAQNLIAILLTTKRIMSLPELLSDPSLLKVPY